MKILSKGNVQKLKAVAEKDPDFPEKLVKNPKETLSKTLGKPVSDKDLEKVSGGFGFGGFLRNNPAMAMQMGSAAGSLSARIAGIIGQEVGGETGEKIAGYGAAFGGEASRGFGEAAEVMGSLSGGRGSNTSRF